MIQRFGKQEIEAVKNCITNASYLSGYTNKYLGGEEIQKFESEFAKFHNNKYGIAVNSGTTALFVAQKAMNIKNKTKVAVPCITFTSTVSQVVANGGTPSAPLYGRCRLRCCRAGRPHPRGCGPATSRSWIYPSNRAVPHP